MAGTSKNSEKKLYLVAIKGLNHQVVAEGTGAFCRSRQAEKEKDPAWRGWYFLVRTPEGYRNTPILPKDWKPKKKYVPFQNQPKASWTPYKD